MEEDKEEEKQDPKDLVREYDEYLKARAEQQRMDVDEHIENDDQSDDVMASAANLLTQNLDKFNYMEQKQMIRNRFHEWLSDEREHTNSLNLLAKFKNQTQSVASSLCE